MFWLKPIVGIILVHVRGIYLIVDVNVSIDDKHAFADSYTPELRKQGFYFLVFGERSILANRAILYTSS